MKHIISVVLILALILVAGCQKTADTSTAAASSEEAELDHNLDELEELDNLDAELELDFDEMEEYLK